MDANYPDMYAQDEYIMGHFLFDTQFDCCRAFPTDCVETMATNTTSTKNTATKATTTTTSSAKLVVPVSESTAKSEH